MAELGCRPPEARRDVGQLPAPITAKCGPTCTTCRSLLDFEALAARLDGNPDFLRFASVARLRDAERRLARSQRRPDVEVSGGVRQLEESNDQALVMGISVPLFPGRRAAPAIAEADALRELADVERDAAPLEARTRLYGLYEQLRQANRETETLRRRRPAATGRGPAGDEVRLRTRALRLPGAGGCPARLPRRAGCGDRVGRQCPGTAGRDRATDGRAPDGRARCQCTGEPMNAMPMTTARLLLAAALLALAAGCGDTGTTAAAGNPAAASRRARITRMRAHEHEGEAGHDAMITTDHDDEEGAAGPIRLTPAQMQAASITVSRGGPGHHPGAPSPVRRRDTERRACPGDHAPVSRRHSQRGEARSATRSARAKPWRPSRATRACRPTR